MSPLFFFCFLGVYVNDLIDRSGYSTFNSLDEMDVGWMSNFLVVV